MATTLQDVEAAMTGFPRALKWSDFPARAVSPNPPMEAQTGASFLTTTGVVKLVDGEYRFHGAKATVSLNPGATWAIPSARTSAALLQHEQGHYDIAGLIARDWIWNVLDLAWHEDVISCFPEAGYTPQAHMNFVRHKFQAEINRFNTAATSLMNRLGTDPATGADGLYDAQTNHSQNAAGQKEWNEMLQRLKSGPESFELWLHIAGII